MKFISHLDLLRLFGRAINRAGLPGVFTKGFNPHHKISITKALKLGIESASEEAVFYMEDIVTPQAFMESMNAQLPEGIRLSAAEEII